MSINLLEMIKDQVTTPLARGMSNYLGASESVVSEVLEGIFPVLLKSTIQTCKSEDSTSQFGALIEEMDLNLTEDIEYILKEISQYASKLSSTGSKILDYIIGDKMVTVVDHFSRNNRLGGGTVSSLLKFAAPFLLVQINNAVNVKDHVALIEFLSDQNSNHMLDIPSDLKKNLNLTED